MQDNHKTISINHLAELIGVTPPTLQGWAAEEVIWHLPGSKRKRYDADEVFIALVLGQLVPYGIRVKTLGDIAHILRETWDRDRDSGWVAEREAYFAKKAVREGGEAWAVIMIERGVAADEPRLQVLITPAFDGIKKLQKEKPCAFLVVDLKLARDRVLEVFSDAESD